MGIIDEPNGGNFILNDIPMGRARTCIACGRRMARGEGNVSGVGDLCHPDDPNLRDCYHQWTVHGDHTRNTKT